MKIAVLGYAGSGKTYLSDYIAEKKNIPVLHLDDIKWDKEWKPIDDSVVLPQVAEFMAQNDWIIDGYYTYLMIDERLQNADKIEKKERQSRHIELHKAQNEIKPQKEKVQNLTPARKIYGSIFALLFALTSLSFITDIDILGFSKVSFLGLDALQIIAIIE